MPQENSIVKGLLRLIVIALISAPPMVAAGYISYDTIPIYSLLLIFKTIIPIFSASFICFAFGDQVCYKLKLYDQRDSNPVVEIPLTESIPLLSKQNDLEEKDVLLIL